MHQPASDPQQPPTPPPGFGPPPPQYAPAPGPAQYAQPPQPYAPYPAAAPPQLASSGPEFLAVDRHNSIVVDASGVTFEDHDVTIDLPWPEIRSVHYRPTSNGKGLVLGVVHADGQFYECTVDAKRRERVHEWFMQLVPVLQYYRPMG